MPPSLTRSVRPASCGNENSEIGWQTFELNTGTLSAGAHTITIGAYKNKKTLNDESTELLIDDVLGTVEPSSTLLFTPANWIVPLAVTVTAVDDAVVEGPHTSTITHTSSSTDPNYNGLTIGSVVAGITDNDTAGGNESPIVDAGPNQTIEPSDVAILKATVSDDGTPDPPGAVQTTWTQVTGPGIVTFGDSSSVDTTASFSAVGTYVLRLTADDSELTTSDELTVTVATGEPILYFA